MILLRFSRCVQILLFVRVSCLMGYEPNDVKSMTQKILKDTLEHHSRTFPSITHVLAATTTNHARHSHIINTISKVSTVRLIVALAVVDGSRWLAWLIDSSHGPSLARELIDSLDGSQTAL